MALRKGRGCGPWQGQLCGETETCIAQRKMAEKILHPSGISCPLNGQGRCAFEEVAVYFSEAEWDSLTGEEKELYREVMMENFQTLRSLGWIWTTPPVIAEIEQGEEPCVRSPWHASDTRRPVNIGHADGVTTIRWSESTSSSSVCLSSVAARCCTNRICKEIKNRNTSSDTQESASHQHHMSTPTENSWKTSSPITEEPTSHGKKILPEHSVFTELTPRGYSSVCIKEEPAEDNPAETPSNLTPQQKYTPAHIKEEPGACPSCTPTPGHLSTRVKEEPASNEQGKVTNAELHPSVEPPPQDYTSTHIRDLGFFVRILKGFIFAESEGSPTHNSDIRMQLDAPERTRLPSECKIVFSSNAQSGSHHLIHPTRTFSCSKCKEHFQCKSDLETHEGIHLQDKGFKCPDCGKRFDCRSKMAEHLVSQTLASSDCVKKDHPNTTNFRKALHITQERTCNGDLVTYLSIKTTPEEEKNLTGAEGLLPKEQTTFTITSSDKTTEKPDPECDEAPQGGNSGGYFTRRAGPVIDQGSDEMDDWLEYKKMSSNSIQRQRIHKQKVYPCSKCKKIFEQKSNLFAHEQIHRKDSLFKAAALRKCFGSSLFVSNAGHGNGGTSVTKERCLPVTSSGSRVSAGSHNLLVRQMYASTKGHRRTNSDADKEKKLTCLVCRESFLYNADLLLHLRAHTGAKPPECSGCGKSFKNYVELVIHQKSHSGGKRSPGSGACSVCHKQSGRSGSR